MKKPVELKKRIPVLRIKNLTVVLIGLAILIMGVDGTAAPRISLKLIVSGLKYPVDINHAGDGSKRLFVVEQEGFIRIIKDGTLADQPFLNIFDRVRCCGEQGLLGVAFHPEFETNGYFYVNYTTRSRSGVGEAGDTVIARYEVSSDDPDRVDPDSESILLVVPQPYSNHNAGKLLFSPIDGYLYIPLGDGGSGGDPRNLAQDPEELLGKILRIDVDTASSYAIPTDNPFVGSDDTLEEIWALGLRNPWRFSFDRQTGDMYIGDVGQNDFEEIDYQAADAPGGQNYGWRCRDGKEDYNFSKECESLTLTEPILDYSHSLGYSVTGGFVYRGSKYPALAGHYFFADYGSGKIWSIFKLDAENWSEPNDECKPEPCGRNKISTFGEDEDGELYLADRDRTNGAIYQIIDICEADTDGDQDVDGVDRDAYMSDYAPAACSGDCPKDLNGDRVVDNEDIKVLANDFGRNDCPN